jgi:putative effector of murein hydrolase LrgA (UPF0299 family)
MKKNSSSHTPNLSTHSNETSMSRAVTNGIHQAERDNASSNLGCMLIPALIIAVIAFFSVISKPGANIENAAILSGFTFLMVAGGIATLLSKSK